MLRSPHARRSGNQNASSPKKPDYQNLRCMMGLPRKAIAAGWGWLSATRSAHTSTMIVTSRHRRRRPTKPAQAIEIKVPRIVQQTPRERGGPWWSNPTPMLALPLSLPG
jgi:hypothetical protein